MLKLVTMLLPSGCLVTTEFGAWLTTCPVLVLMVRMWSLSPLTVMMEGLPTMTFRLCMVMSAPVALRLTVRLLLHLLNSELKRDTLLN